MAWRLKPSKVEFVRLKSPFKKKKNDNSLGIQQCVDEQPVPQESSTNEEKIEFVPRPRSKKVKPTRIYRNHIKIWTPEEITMPVSNANQQNQQQDHPTISMPVQSPLWQNQTHNLSEIPMPSSNPYAQSNPQAHSEEPPKHQLESSDPQDVKPSKQQRASTVPRLEDDAPLKIVNTKNVKIFTVHFSHIVKNVQADSYHRFVVKTPVYDKDAIIAAINATIQPLSISPYYFHEQDGILSFLATNCIQAIFALAIRNLEAKSVVEGVPDIQFEIKIGAAKVDLNAIFEKITLKRLDKEKKFLDFSNLADIPELRDITPRPCADMELFCKLLRTAMTVAPDLKIISLANNELVDVEPLNAAFMRLGYKNDLSKLTLRVLDLSYNNIKTMGMVTVIQTTPLTEICLHHNPLCRKYEDDGSYVSSVTRAFKGLKKLDGIYLHSTPGLPYWKPNFIVQSSWGDSSELADQFLEHFFTLYDVDRSKMLGLYHTDAYFSLSAACLSGQTTSSNARLIKYMAENRDLLHISGPSEEITKLYHGANNIIGAFKNLPKTEHDPYTFTVDIVQHSVHCTVLTVTGIFREPSLDDSQPVSPRHFMRTFVLVGIANDEYKIVNDILFTTNATTAQAEEAFLYTHFKSGSMSPLPGDLPDEEKENITAVISKVTEMTTPWARKCLEDSNWDMIEALTVFTELFKEGKIPDEAFGKKS